MERLTKRVGVGEAVPVADGNICAPFEKAGLCKTGIQGGFSGRWERHCNDTCVLGTIIDKLAAYEDSRMTPEEVMELANQRKAGLLEVRPCAVGDTIYVIRTRYKKSAYSELMYDFAIQTNPDRLRAFPGTCYVGEKICTKTDLRFIGKTAFTTREEALAKIEEAKQNARCPATE